MGWGLFAICQTSQACGEGIYPRDCSLVFRRAWTCGEGACSRWAAQQTRDIGIASRSSGSKLPRHNEPIQRFYATECALWRLAAAVTAYPINAARIEPVRMPIRSMPA